MRFLSEDLFVALNAGRDVLSGKLAQPDTWSFTTGGSIWVDQGWLSHTFLYLSHRALGDLGPVLCSLILLVACLTILYFRSRSLGVSREISVLALTIGTLSVAPFLQIRAENFGLLCFVLTTTLLTAPRSWGLVRYVGTMLVLLLWSNSHGSFVVGWALVGLRLFVEILGRFNFVRQSRFLSWKEEPHGGPADPGRFEVWGWGLTLAVGIFTAALVNPFGWANLLMPYRQLTAGTVTGRSADWLPLLDWRSLVETGFFHPFDVRPFLFSILIVLVLVAALFGASRAGSARPSLFIGLTGGSRSDLIMVILIPLVMIPLCFRFRRIVLFAGISLIPLLALLLQSWTTAIVNRDPTPGRRNHLRVLSFVASCFWLGFVGWVFVGSTLLLYLPSNPTRPDRPLAGLLMSYDPYRMGIVDFMKKNGISGRLFTSWTIADLLLFHVPKVRVFMDCRDQSAYSDDVIKTYFAILNTDGTTPGYLRGSLAVLKRLRVSAIVLQTNPRDYDLATLLMSTRKWACIYKDDKAFLLVPTDSERFASFLGTGRLPPLWYPDQRTRVVSGAFLADFMTGKIPPDIIENLKTVVRNRPDPDAYGLLYMAGREASGCVSGSMKTYLRSEVSRLSAIDPLTPGIGRAVLQSLIRILSLLRMDEKLCSPGERTDDYRVLLNASEEKLRQLERKYLGYARQ